MAAHRYWKVKIRETFSAGHTTEMSQAWLLQDGVRVDELAELSADGVVTGEVGSLSNGTTDSTVALLLPSELIWDFGSPTAVNDFRFGSTGDVSAFPYSVDLFWSDDNASWNLFATRYALAYPGDRQMTTSNSQTVSEFPEFQQIAIEGRGADASAPIKELTGKRLVAVGQPYVSPSANFPDGAIRFDGASYFKVPVQTSFDFGSDDFGIRFQYEWVTRSSQFPCLMSGYRTWPSNGSLSIFDGHVAVPGKLTVAFNGVFPFLQSTFDTQPNTKYEVELSRSAGVIYLLINGVVQGSAAYTGAFRIETDSLYVATSPDIPGQTYFNGRMRRIQFRRGAAFSTVAHTPNDSVIPTAQTITTLDFPFRTANAAVSHLLPDFRFSATARGRIAGTVKEKGTPTNTPLARRVRLYRDRDGMLIRESWSNAAGDYVFDNIEEGEAYTVLALDHTHTYRAVVADNLSLANGALEVV